MRTVSFQGTQLTAGQRRQMEQRQQAKPAFLAPHLQQMLDDSAREIARMKEQGTQGENPNKFKLDYQVKGTPWLGDVFGFATYETEESNHGI
ncbi:hypothetical protein BVH03_09455 [Pseudomonas sp. PA15(2017)]|uniref:hypothetical protein n=1 Tax=Pseudomonas sp. PA15(2017) TaxID=1932111 RepID=UPI000963F787|nr:hypothetical protein [Pseudomonas sp. PA15(2017)]OLU30706.1 hypothetical protein BVH03_09455 [Pseudomonas sp. PA15(2017)]